MKQKVRLIKLELSLQGRWLSFMMLFLFLIVVSCETTGDHPQYNPPADHSVNKDGVMHKSGLSEPEQNCTTCHGADLQGGTAQVSCYECHGKKW